MAAKRNKIYQPPQRTNPEVIARKLDKLSSELDHHKKLIQAINKANDIHVEHLSNFVRHDMKNAIQGLDGIVYNAKKENSIPTDIIGQLETALALLRSSLGNFSCIIPSSNEQNTTLPKVLSAVELLSRGTLLREHVDFEFSYDRASSTIISQPLQALVQVIHNLVINGINSIDGNTEKLLLVKGSVSSNGGVIKVYDNGNPIPSENKEKIFEYGFSTTNGTGVGLFHAKCVLIEMGGDVILEDSDLESYTKCFTVKFSLNN